MDCLKKKESSKEIPRISAIPDLDDSFDIFGIFGMIKGATKEASANASNDTKMMMKMWTATNKRAQYRLMRESIDFSKNRYERDIQGSLCGGVRIGMIGAGWSALQTWLAEKRGVHDLYNIVGASSAAGAVYELELLKPGSLVSRASNGLMGAACGVVIAVPIGWYHLKHYDK